MAPLVDLTIDVEWPETLGALGDHDLRPALVHVLDDPVRIERLVGDQATEFEVFDKRGDANGIVSLSRQQNEAHQVAQAIGQDQDFGRPTAF